MTERDYSKGLIYKICCKNSEVKELYVGSTTNFKQRKSCHKNSCNNDKHIRYNVRVYQFIRDNGGWDNWEMVLVEQYEARDKRHLEQRERYWLELLQATLNMCVPTQTKKEWTTRYYEENKEKKEERKQYNINYKEEHKEQSSERDNKKFNCDICGGKYTRKSKARHERLQKHIAYINENNNVIVEKCV